MWFRRSWFNVNRGHLRLPLIQTSSPSLKINRFRYRRIIGSWNSRRQKRVFLKTRRIYKIRHISRLGSMWVNPCLISFERKSVQYGPRIIRTTRFRPNKNRYLTPTDRNSKLYIRRLWLQNFFCNIKQRNFRVWIKQKILVRNRN